MSGPRPVCRDDSDEHIGIWRAAIDTGGSQEEYMDASRRDKVYRWLLKQRPWTIFGTKGVSGPKAQEVLVKISILQKFPDGRIM